MNKKELIERATNPKQYDLTDLNFPEIGSADSPFRLMVWEYIQSLNLNFTEKTVLDIGCGVGWLMKRIGEHNPSKIVGIEPSKKIAI